MIHLKAQLIKLLKSIGVYSWQGAISYFVGLLLAYILLQIPSEILNILIRLLNIQTPLWATIALPVLCCLYIYVRVVKTLSKLNQEGQSSLTSKAERIKVLEAENEYLIQKIRDIGNNWNPGIL